MHKVNGAIIGTIFGTRKGEHEHRVAGLRVAPASRSKGF
jgi:hypothetical protein